MIRTCTSNPPAGAAPVAEHPFTLYRSETRFRLRSLRILVDQPAEDASAAYGAQIGHGRWGYVLGRRALFTALMRPVLVVVPDVFIERGEQVPPVIDQDPVEAFSSDRAHPAFGIRVR